MTGPAGEVRTAIAIRTAAARLAAAGVPSPRHDAEALVAHVLGMSRSRLPLVDALSGAQEQAYDEAVTRRAAREPLQHITGRAAFRRLDLAVGPGVFLPRPETEVMVQWCLDHLVGEVVVDLCAGSGAIALAIAQERPGVTAYAVEREPAAFAWLETNARGSAVRCVQADVAAVPTALPQLAGTVDLVVSNPPYIPLGARPLEREVADHDPGTALWGGPDGLDVVRVVQRVACRLLRRGGLLAVEHADVQGASVPALLRAAGWSGVEDHRDLAGRDRYTTAVRSP